MFAIHIAGLLLCCVHARRLALLRTQTAWTNLCPARGSWNVWETARGQTPMVFDQRGLTPSVSSVSLVRISLSCAEESHQSMRATRKAGDTRW